MELKILPQSVSDSSPSLSTALAAQISFKQIAPAGTEDLINDAKQEILSICANVSKHPFLGSIDGKIATRIGDQMKRSFSFAAGIIDVIGYSHLDGTYPRIARIQQCSTLFDLASRDVERSIRNLEDASTPVEGINSVRALQAYVAESQSLKVFLTNPLDLFVSGSPSENLDLNGEKSLELSERINEMAQTVLAFAHNSPQPERLALPQAV